MPRPMMRRPLDGLDALRDDCEPLERDEPEALRELVLSRTGGLRPVELLFVPPLPLALIPPLLRLGMLILG